MAKEEREGPVADGSNALIVGYGRFGQTVAQMLVAQGIGVTLIDTDIEMIDVAGSFGAKVYYGDGTRLDLLRQAGARRGRADPVLHRRRPDRAELVEAVHEAFPNATIFVRAFDRRALLKLKGAPVAGVVREVLEFGGADGADGDGERRRRPSRRSTGPRISTAPATASG